MIVFFNGKFLLEQQAVVSVFDRSFLYGDGLFETALVVNGMPFRWTQHLQRLEAGAAFLGIKLPFDPAELRAFAERLLRENRTCEGLIRLTLSRGIGLRGYSPRGANSPVIVMTTHPPSVQNIDTPQSWRLTTSSFRLPAGEPLAQFKTCNKLAQILAKAQGETQGTDEALLLNTDGFIVEGASSNFFWIQDGIVCTPPLASGILSGVTRQVVRELCSTLGLTSSERNITPGKVLQAQGVFMTLSSFGIVEVTEIDGQTVRSSPLTGQLQRSFLELVRRETVARA
jgi:aminodeoxychorismate lyase